MCVRRLGRNGNSTIVGIPKSICRALGMQRGDNVALYVEDGRLIVRKLTDEELVGPRSANQAADLFHEERN